MTRDNLLFVLLGFLLGFVGAYLAFEAIAAKQPPRRLPGTAGDSAMSAPESAPAAAAGAAGAGAPQGAAMEEISKLRQYVDEHPEDADAVRRLANLNFDIGSWERARDLYLQYLKGAKPDADVLTDLGITYRQLGASDDALARFREAQKLAPEHWQSRFNEVVVLGLDLGRYDEADRILAELKSAQPGNADIDRLAAEVAKKRKEAA